MASFDYLARPLGWSTVGAGRAVPAPFPPYLLNKSNSATARPARGFAASLSSVFLTAGSRRAASGWLTMGVRVPSKSRIRTRRRQT